MIVYGLIMASSVLGALLIAIKAIGLDDRGAVTVSFLTLALSQLWHITNMRSRGAGLFRNEVTRNPYVWGALALCVALIVIAVYVPGISDVLRLVSPGTAGWLAAIGMSLVPVAAGTAYHLVCRFLDRRKIDAIAPRR